MYIIHIRSKVFNMFPKDQLIEILMFINNQEKLLIFIRMFKNLSTQNHLQKAQKNHPSQNHCSRFK